ncbi:MAG: bifunctional phosphopantothenoylcysteine decarboxylase/phosphopantothenate--cysteine ligase CoaBC [Bacteroidota bacterium]|nr:bifunctional phosphopantothenoylcysteine decarboxylase/phosphopantothenate--cysteine ligase CoaBC [Bacteroidota bacterium]
MLKAKKILVGISGGISVYKMCTVVRLLKKSGAQVRVLMTQSATQFVTPLTFSTLSQEEAVVSLWPSDAHSSTDLGTKHIELGLWADAMVIAPATANIIAKLATGIADDVITSAVLALRCPLLISPAMDVDMYLNVVTQKNLALLSGRGYFILPPEEGELASGLVGTGRLPEPEKIVAFVEDVLNKTPRDLSGKKILVTAGPTHEPIDPVRFIGNRSSGKMGFALANAAALRGGEVTLIAGPVALETPKNVNRINVETAEEMKRAVLAHSKKSDAVIMAAAVADYTPAHPASQKIKKAKLSQSGFTLELKETADILKELSTQKNGALLIGFALETNDAIKNATEKLRSKNLDFIILNSAHDEGAAFGSDTNVVTIIGKDGTTERLPKMPKFDVATEILNRAGRRLAASSKKERK